MSPDKLAEKIRCHANGRNTLSCLYCFTFYADSQDWSMQRRTLCRKMVTQWNRKKIYPAAAAFTDREIARAPHVQEVWQSMGHRKCTLHAYVASSERPGSLHISRCSYCALLRVTCAQGSNMRALRRFRCIALNEEHNKHSQQHTNPKTC